MSKTIGTKENITNLPVSECGKYYLCNGMKIIKEVADKRTTEIRRDAKLRMSSQAFIINPDASKGVLEDEMLRRLHNLSQFGLAMVTNNLDHDSMPCFANTFGDYIFSEANSIEQLFNAHRVRSSI